MTKVMVKEKDIRGQFSHGIVFLCRYQPEQFFSILAIVIKIKASLLAISHTSLQDSIKIPPPIALFLIIT